MKRVLPSAGRRRLASVAALLATVLACTEGGGTAGSRRDEAKPPPEQVVAPANVDRVTEPADDWFESACSAPHELLQRVRRGHAGERSPDVVFFAREPNLVPNNHSGPWDYLQEVPLVFYGPGYIRPSGEVDVAREVTVADLAPTLADLLDSSFPRRRPGRVLGKLLVPRQKREGRPRLIVEVVWDGGGWNVLEAWPQRWPYLRKLMDEGAWVADAIVGSSPSITPPIHANIGTGAFPRQHGIADIKMRAGDRIIDSFNDRSPQYLLLPTLADLYDQRVDNRAKVGLLAYKPWHLAMLGHGAAIEGGDNDIAALVPHEDRFVTNESFYSLPGYLNGYPGLRKAIRRLDQSDGARDYQWLSYDLTDMTAVRDTPAWIEFQTKLIKALLRREGFGDDEVPDLFLTNYKHIDEIGHNDGLLAKEMGEVVQTSDDALRELVRFLDRHVGRRRWIIVLTADHGVTPPPREFNAWAIRGGMFHRHIADHFGLDLKEFLMQGRATGLYVDREVLTREEVTLEEIADFIIDYRIGDNLYEGEKLPSFYRHREREPIFQAAFPSDRLEDVWRCNKRRNAGNS